MSGRRFSSEPLKRQVASFYKIVVDSICDARIQPLKPRLLLADSSEHPSCAGSYGLESFLG